MKPSWPGKGRRGALPHHHQLLALVLSPSRRSCDGCAPAPAPARQDRDHLPGDPLPAGVGVAARQLHQRPVVVPERLVERQQHFGLRHPLAPLGALAQGQEAGGDRVTEAPAPEVDADPERTRLVGEDVDVVVAASHRAELLARLHLQRLPVLGPAPPPRRHPRTADRRSGRHRPGSSGPRRSSASRRSRRPDWSAAARPGCRCCPGRPRSCRSGSRRCRRRCRSPTPTTETALS